jgi:hypothetical protein
MCTARRVKAGGAQYVLRSRVRHRRRADQPGMNGFSSALGP